MIRDPIETFGQYWVWGVAVIFMAIWVIKFPREVYNFYIYIFLAKKKIIVFCDVKNWASFQKTKLKSSKNEL